MGKLRIGIAAATCLVLLRVAIGWHFLYEGLYKIQSYRGPGPRFSAEGYLGSATGPLRDRLRAVLDDPDGLARLDAKSLAQRWARDLERFSAKHSLDDVTRERAKAKLKEVNAAARGYLEDPETVRKLKQYRETLDQIEQREGQTKPPYGAPKAGGADPSATDWLAELRKDAIRRRDELLVPVNDWTAALQAAWTGLVKAPPYLASATGPLGDPFLEHADDADGLKRLDADSIDARWREEVQRFGGRYGLDEMVRQAVIKKAHEFSESTQQYLQSAETAAQVQEYRRAVAALPAPDPKAAKDAGDAFAKQYPDLAKKRDELVRPIDKEVARFRAFVNLECKPDKTESRAAPYWTLGVPWPIDKEVDRVNLWTMWVLTISGACLLLGLFSRLAALSAAGFLGMVYLAHPPWPGLAAVPGDPGHYVYVNRELIECLAALALATLPTGRWLGLDALIRGMITRRFTYWVGGSADDLPAKT